jgi:hypothetical protein
VLQELDHAADLFRRAERAISDEVAILQGLDLDVDWMAVRRACGVLMGVAIQAHIRAKREHERQEALQ